MRRVRWSWLISGALLVGLMLTGTAYGWTNAALLNDSGWSSSDVKTVDITAVPNGGFHAIYNASGRVRYRQYDGSSLGSELTVNSTSTFNPEIGRSDNGDVHVVWENWDGGGPEVGWAISTNGGSSFGSESTISNSSGQAKHPSVQGYGLSSSDDAVMSYWNAYHHEMRYATYDGSNWSSDLGMGTFGNSGYEVHGMAMSPKDGSVWRVYDNGPNMVLRHYSSGSWGSEILVDSTSGMHNRAQLAVNDAGQVMVLWDQDDRYYTVLYTPGAGCGEKKILTYDGSWGKDVTAIPGTNDFYAAWPENSPGRLYGARWSGGGWLSKEQISQNLSDAFTVGPALTAEEDGSETLYCAWEYWGTQSGKPQQYYSVDQGSTPGPEGTLSGDVEDQNGQPVAGATILIEDVAATITITDGSYSMDVPVGTYNVTCSKNYYTSDSASNVVITEDQTTDQDFTITSSTPPSITDFTTKGYDGKIRLTWTNPDTGDHNGTVIRYSTTGYPTSPNEGTQVCDVNRDTWSYVHDNLTNGTTYYYTAFTYHDDASKVYGSGTQTSGSPVAAPKTNLLLNGNINEIISDVAQYWTFTEVNDPNDGTYPVEDYSNYVTSPSQAWKRMDHADLPATGLSGGFLHQQVSSCTSGKIYQFIGWQDIRNDDWNAAGRRYVLNFGINPSGGSSPGTLQFDGTLDNVEWMTSDQALYNDAVASPVRYGGFHKSWAATEADSSTISVWSGVTIDNTGTKDAHSTKFNTDMHFLYEWDLTANNGLQNGNFEGDVLELQNVDPNFWGDDLIPDEWVPVGGAIGEWADLRCSQWGARSGALGMRVCNNRGNINGGLVQKINCTNGYYQTFSAYVLTSGEDDTVGSVGIDPTGGADINSSNVVWTNTSSTSWTKITANATASASSITVFLRAKNTNRWTGGYHYAYFDDCEWSQESSAPTPGSISGVVDDSCGTLIGGATITTSPGSYTTTTNADGTYLLEDVTPNTYTVTASADGYSDTNQGNVVVSSGSNTVADLEFSNNNGSIEGYVVDACGIALEGITVETDTGGYSATTDANGQYNITQVSAGTYDVTASGDGYYTTADEDVSVTACNTTTVNFELDPGTETDELVSGDFEDSYISFWGGTIAKNWGASFRGSFEDATWEYNNWGSGRGYVQRIYALDSGFEAGISQQVSGLTPGAHYTFNAEAYQTDGGTTAWIAVDPDGGTTLPGAYVSFENNPLNWTSGSVEGNVGPDGVVTVFLWARYQWGPGGSVYFDDAELLVEGLGELTGSIDGYVTNGSGDPIANATVASSTGGYSDTTDSNGYYFINAVAQGTYDLTASADGYEDATKTGVTVSGCTTTAADITLTATPTQDEVLENGDMEGGFWDTGWGGGSAIPNDWDGWYNPGDANCYDETTIVHGDDHSARFTISSGGDAGSGGYKRGIYQNVTLGSNASFTITVWTQHTNGNCPAIMCWNSGHDEDDPADAAGTDRYQWVTDDNWNDVDTWVTNTLSGTAPSDGKITVIVGGAHHGGGGSGYVYIDDVSVVGDSGTVTTGTISGTVYDDSSNVVEGATVSTDTGGYSTTTDANGNYTLVDVLAGDYDVTASKIGYDSDTENDVTVTAGENTPVDFTLSESSTPVEVLDNGDMEDGFWNTGWGEDSNIPNDWDGWYNLGDFDCDDNTTIVNGGSHSAGTSISAGGDSGSGGYKRGIYQNVYVGANAGFTFEVYARHSNGNCPSIMCWNYGQDASNPENAYDTSRYQWVTTDNWNDVGSWVNRSMTGTADSTGWITVIVGGAHHGGGGTGYVYIDDVSVTTP